MNKNENNYKDNSRGSYNMKKNIIEKKNPVEKMTKYSYHIDENERKLFFGSDFLK